ncbi:MAG: hypothetical protein H6736_00235 [Alphaproteobacteria bacterium]|nr:hypothetical protein [Alphaproteobacteria bacterium]
MSVRHEEWSSDGYSATRGSWRSAPGEGTASVQVDAHGIVTVDLSDVWMVESHGNTFPLASSISCRLPGVPVRR